MPDDPLILEPENADKHFSAKCFNRAWELMEKKDRTYADDEEMFAASMASLWHWMQRKDLTTRNLSVGYWQVSRICSLLNRPEEAMQYGDLSLKYSDITEPFYRGYAHEAIARAARLMGDIGVAQEHVRQGLKLAATIQDAEERESLEGDLRGITGGTPGG